MAATKPPRRQRDTDEPVILASATTTEIVQGDFLLRYDYSQVAAEHRAAVMASAQTIKRHERRTIENMVVIGRELQAVQEKLPHGQFLPWIEQEFGWQKSVAYNLLNLATKFPTVGNLPVGIGLTALYQLTAAPDSALLEAQTRQQTGEKITKATATEIAARHRQAQQRGEPPPPPSHVLTGAEAIALIWRGLKQHHHVQSQDVKAQNQERLQWLQSAPLRLFVEMIQPAVTYTEPILHTAIEAVKTELQGNINHIERIESHHAQSTPKTAQSDAHPGVEGREQVRPIFERLPDYLRAAGCSLTRLPDGALSAQLGDQQRLFAGTQHPQAIAWLDTLVRSAATEQDRRQRRTIALLTKTLADLREAHTLASGAPSASLNAGAAKLAAAIPLIEQALAALSDATSADDLATPPLHSSTHT